MSLSTRFMSLFYNRYELKMALTFLNLNVCVWQAEFKSARRASLQEVESRLRLTRMQIEMLEAFAAWVLETAASLPWGIDVVCNIVLLHVVMLY
jgi:hypothetical protein